MWQGPIFVGKPCVAIGEAHHRNLKSVGMTYDEASDSKFSIKDC